MLLFKKLMISPEQKICLIILAYLIGSISTSIIICRIKKVDIRKIGSGNPGATNTVRALGKKYGLLVFFLDFLKGAIPTIIATYLSEGLNILPICCAFASVLGHVFPIYFSFNGGKGVATFIGAIFIIFPLGALISLTMFILILIFSGYASLATISGAISLPLSILIFSKSDLIFFGIAALLFILISHYKNIIRLIKGNEDQFNKIHIFNPDSFWRKNNK